ncbi:vWA domain-containing protein [Butyrivibrio sp. WCE2006]|uniref:vWA domain-containing protein n=1 Tax=Butyrivibrio sp. WCE2006 TaxID=1410611 RepID=UPI0005D18D26|nr:VWA domain-containing protein [Butyrivibrio sp. WCE2006]
MKIKGAVSKGLPGIITIALLLLCVFVVGNLHGSTSIAGSTPESAEEYFVFLAEKAMAEGDLTAAEYYIDSLYSKCGQTAQGTLCCARLCVLKEDYVGARLLYEKLESTGNSSVMTDTDSVLFSQIQNNQVMDIYSASNMASQIKLLQQDGVNPTYYGYTSEQVDVANKVLNGSLDPIADMTELLANDITEKTNANAHVEGLSEAVKAAEDIGKEYANYIEHNNADIYYLKKYLESFNNLYANSKDAFKISGVDEAYVRLLIMLGERETLAKYADESGSQLALVAVGQMLIDRNMKQSDLPKGFASLDDDEVNAVNDQCEKALKNVRKRRQGIELRNYENKVKNVGKASENAALIEINDRIKPGKEDIKDQSALYMGKAAISYAVGNTDKGDKCMNKSMETYPYSNDSAYIEACEDISATKYGAGDQNEIRDVGEAIDKAYKKKVPHVNPEEPKVEEEEEETELEPVEEGEYLDPQDPENFEELLEREDDADITTQLSAAHELASAYTTCIAKENAALNIGKIDTTKFPTVSFNLQTSEPIEDLSNPQLAINDCNIVITDYTVEEVKYDKAILFAVCDKSGSMEGSEKRLQSAVRNLARSLSENESMGVIGFSDGVDFNSHILASPSDVIPYLEDLNPGGGTNIASGTFAALSEVGKHDDTINVVIVMTDGEDDSFDGNTLNRLKNMTNDGHTVVYTVGMGSSVNSSYLQTVARAGNGRFVYSFSASELNGIYDFIHAQMENNYVVTFKAVETKKKHRVLTCANKADGYAMTKEYFLGDEEEAQEEIIEEEDVPFDCTGFSTKKIYREVRDVEGFIRGKGFESGMSCFVTLDGKAFQHTYVGNFVSDESFSVMIPGEVPPGEYEAFISVNGKTFKDRIEIFDGAEQVFKYGAYVFFGNRVLRDEENEKITITGDVRMNGFLHFDGDVLIEGDIKDNKVTMSSDSGSYIISSRPLLGMMMLLGNKTDVGNWNQYPLYKDEAHLKDFENYKVETVRWADADSWKAGVFIMQQPEYTLYPDKFAFKAGEISWNFPCVSGLFKKITKKDNPLKFAVQMEGFVDNQGLFTKGGVNAEDVSMKLSLLGGEFGLKKFDFKWDTYKDDYDLTLLINGSVFKRWGNVKGDEGTNNFGFEIAAVDGYFSKFRIYADIPVSVLVGGVPVTFSNFFVGISDFHGQEDARSFSERLACSSLEGGTDISVAALKSVSPGLASWLGDDLCIVKFEETKLAVNLFKADFASNSTIKLFGEIEFGKLDWKIGNMDYKSFVLGLTRSGYGMSFDVPLGPNLELPRFKLTGQQGYSLAGISSAFRVGIKEHGALDIDIITKWKGEFDGAVEEGWYMISPDRIESYIGVRGKNSSNQQVAFRIGFSGYYPYISLK